MITSLILAIYISIKTQVQAKEWNHANCHEENQSILWLVCIKIRLIKAATFFTFIYFPQTLTPKCFCTQCPCSITFSHQRGSMILVLEGSHKLFWTKTRSSHDLSLAWEIVVQAAANSYSSHQYFSPCLEDGTSNVFYCSNWCYSEKLFLSVPAILHEGNWHLMKNLWLSKCCNFTPISIFESIKI